MENIFTYILAFIVGILTVLFMQVTKKKMEKPDKKDYDKIKEDKENELKEKPATDIVNSLDNADAVESIKQDSNNKFDEEYNRRKSDKRRAYLDGFRSSGNDSGTEDNKE